jgi:phage gpG-like protein
MTRIAISVNGAEPTIQALGKAGAGLSQPTRPLLEIVAAEMQTAFQRHIREARGPEGGWPALKPQTRAIRRYYGHGAADPRLIRGSDLLHSITTLALEETAVDVGTRLRYARVLQDGGEVADGPRSRTVQAFPFVFLDSQEEADLIEMVGHYFLEGGGA